MRGGGEEISGPWLPSHFILAASMNGIGLVSHGGVGGGGYIYAYADVLKDDGGAITGDFDELPLEFPPFVVKDEKRIPGKAGQVRETGQHRGKDSRAGMTWAHPPVCTTSVVVPYGSKGCDLDPPPPKCCSQSKLSCNHCHCPYPLTHHHVICYSSPSLGASPEKPRMSWPSPYLGDPSVSGRHLHEV